VLTWDNNTNNPPELVVGSAVYFSTNYFANVNWRVNIPYPLNLITQAVTIGPIYSAFVTAVGSSTLESKPSNQIRYQRFLATIGKTNLITLQGSTNWNEASLVEYPKYGILSGTPPNLTYQPTSFIYTVKDYFTYRIPETFEGYDVINYYSVHFRYGNNPPIIQQNTDNIEMR
jgi:hypothetical protein